MLGWGVPTFDALYTLQIADAHASGTGGDGNFNLGRYSNPRMDAAGRPHQDRDRPAGAQPAADRRRCSCTNDDVSHIPLHNQMIPWAMRKNIDVVHRADNRLDGDWSR